MNWTQIWVDMFGTTEWFGLNMGFWVSSAVVALVVVIMNVVLWNMKPLSKKGAERSHARLEASLDGKAAAQRRRASPAFSPGTPLPAAYRPIPVAVCGFLFTEDSRAN